MLERESLIRDAKMFDSGAVGQVRGYEIATQQQPHNSDVGNLCTK
jgi:hypothetical protein